MNSQNSTIIEKIVLGTAQFFMDYGIANISGIPKRKELFDILEHAWQNGIYRFDTAPGYGSESLLGEFISSNGLQKNVKILTKIPSLKGISNYQNYIRNKLELSLQFLGCPIDVLFFHDPCDSTLLIEDPVFFEKIKIDYPITTIGVSVYEPKDVEALENLNTALAFQFPFNILDRRFEKINMTFGKRYARSIFLQGLLASQRGLRKDAPRGLLDLHKKYHHNLLKKNIDPIKAAISFTAMNEIVDYFLIGVETKKQLIEILVNNFNLNQELRFLEPLVKSINKKWIDPRKWS